MTKCQTCHKQKKDVALYLIKKGYPSRRIAKFLGIGATTVTRWRAALK